MASCPTATHDLAAALDANAVTAVTRLVERHAQSTPAVSAPPTGKALAALAVTTMLPAIGFGFVDNFLMIIAGDYIDVTIGVTLGISAMAAAGLGNMVSDWGGIGLQGFIEQKLGGRVRLPVRCCSCRCCCCYWCARWRVGECVSQ
jgi:hypothetical protein